MESIEIIRLILQRNIYRTSRCNWQFQCLHTTEPITKLVEKYPMLNKSDLLSIISKEIYIKQGKNTDFIWGYSKCARIINDLLKN